MKSSVLLVDQDTAETAALVAALRAEGFDVDVASTESDALRALARGEHAIALVELMLRGETGLALARRIHDEAPATKVFLTGLYVLSERQLERAGTGASGFVPKPWDIGEVAAFLASKAAASSSRPHVPVSLEADDEDDAFDRHASGVTGAHVVADIRRRASA